MSNIESKVCSKCKQDKPLTEYPFRDKERKTYRSICKFCHNSYNMAVRRGEVFRPPPPPVEHGVVKAPALNLWERPVYVPPKWNGPIR